MALSPAINCIVGIFLISILEFILFLQTEKPKHNISFFK